MFKDELKKYLTSEIDTLINQVMDDVQNTDNIKFRVDSSDEIFDSKNNYILYGDILINDDVDEINVFLNVNFGYSDLPEKYNDNNNYDIGVGTDEEFFPDGKVLGKEKIQSSLNRLNSLSFLDKKVNIHISLSEFEDLDLGKGFNLHNLTSSNTKKRLIIDKINLKNDTSLNINNSEEAINKFSELAEKQRDKPEHQMLKIQKMMTGGVLSHQVEHIGDLTHRISQKVYIRNSSVESSLTDIVPKIERGLRSLKSKYGFEKEHNENVFNAYEGRNDLKEKYKTLESYDKALNKEFDDYSKLHSELKVYNIVQYHCREAAVTLGKKEFDKTIKHLEALDDIIKKEEFVYKASQYNPNFERELNIKQKIKPKI
jgi:hypothetical protein